MTVALFVEALTTIRALGWALVAVAWPCNAARDALRGAVAAERALRALPEHRQARNAADAHTAPSWARTETEDAA